MSLQRLARRVIWLMTRPSVRDARRALHAWRRTLSGQTATVHYFHQADDPYGHLCLQVLPALASRYAIRIVPHLVGPPSDAAAPDRDRLAQWSTRDACELARHLGLEAPGRFAPMPADRVTGAQAGLVQAFAQADWQAQALAISRAAWAGEGKGADPSGAQAGRSAVQEALARGDALRKKLGHYLGATFQFEGEWYWGLDRLHHLEQRLREAGLCKDASLALIAAPPKDPGARLAIPGPGPASAHHLSPVPADLAVHFFLSFRSPYTYLAAARVRQLAAHHGVTLVLRPVLPMVMRGLAVPLEKRLYILGDVAREARRLSLPFGLMCDPVGKPVERGYAVLYRAMTQGRGEAFVESFLQGVWSEGADAGRDEDLIRLALRAGLPGDEVKAALADEAWRAPVEANRQALLAQGLWGVPSFQLVAGGQTLCSAWGQDRLWQIDQALQSFKRPITEQQT